MHTRNFTSMYAQSVKINQAKEETTNWNTLKSRKL